MDAKIPKRLLTQAIPIPISSNAAKKIHPNTYVWKSSTSIDYMKLCMVYPMDINEIISVNLMCNYKCVDEANINLSWQWWILMSKISINQSVTTIE